MKRRVLLTSMAALAGGIAGCGASDSDEATPSSTTDWSATSEPSRTTGGTPDPVGQSTTTDPTTTEAATTVRPSTAHTVRVETKRVAPMTGRELRVVAGPDGDLSVTHSCDGASNERTKPLAADAHDALVRAVLSADLSSMKDKYECTGDCPKDVPGKRYVLTVDGTETEVYVEAQAETVPDGLVAIQQQLDALRDDVETPSCGTPSG